MNNPTNVQEGLGEAEDPEAKEADPHAPSVLPPVAPVRSISASLTALTPSHEDNELLEPQRQGFLIKFFKMIQEADDEIITWEDGELPPYCLMG